MPREHTKRGSKRELPGCSEGRSGGSGLEVRRIWGDRKAPKTGWRFSVLWDFSVKVG